MTVKKKIKTKIKNFLLWVQNYTNTDMLYLVKGGSWLGLSQLVSTGAAFGLSLLYANFLPKETFGTYKFILSIGGLFSVFTLGGIDTAVEKYVANEKEGNIKKHFKTKIKWGSIGSLFCFLASFYYLLQTNNVLFISFLILGFFLPFYYSSTFYSSILSGKKKFKKLSLFRIKEIVFSFLIVGTTILVSSNINILLFSFLFSWSLIRYFHFYKSLKLVNESLSKKIEAESYGKHLSVMEVLGKISTKIEEVSLWYFIGPEAIAVYFFAKKPAKLIKEPLKKIDLIAFPKFSEKDETVLKKTLLPKIFKLIGVVTLIVLLYIILSPTLFATFFPEYMNAVFYTQVYSITRIISPINQFLYSALTAQEKTMELYKIRTTSDLMRILVVLISIPSFGIIGLIIGLIIVKLVRAVISVYYFKK